jgi:hypothetical protein
MVSGRQASLGDACRDSFDKYYVLVKLWLAAVTAHVLVIGAAYFGGQILIRWTGDGLNPMSYYGIVAGGVVVGLTAILIVMTIHDHARIRCLETGDAAIRSALWACGYIVAERRAIFLSLMLIATTIAAWLIYQTSATFMPADSPAGLTVSLVWAQAFMAFRALVRVWSSLRRPSCRAGGNGHDWIATRGTALLPIRSQRYGRNRVR